MENATKALLIAAAVLIAIVLIALGIKLLKAGGDISDEAEGAGKILGEYTGSNANKLVYQMKKDKVMGFAREFGVKRIQNVDLMPEDKFPDIFAWVRVNGGDGGMSEPKNIDNLNGISDIEELAITVKGNEYNYKCKGVTYISSDNVIIFSFEATLKN